MLRVSIGLFKRPSRCAGSAPERSQPTEASLKKHFAWIGLLEAECEREKTDAHRLLYFFKELMNCTALPSTP